MSETETLDVTEKVKMSQSTENGREEAANLLTKRQADCWETISAEGKRDKEMLITPFPGGIKGHKNHSNHLELQFR